MTKSTIESDHIRRGIGISWDSTRMGGEAGTPITATRWRNLAPAERERLVNFFKTHAQEMSSPTDEWEECAFEDIQKGDRVKWFYRDKDRENTCIGVAHRLAYANEAWVTENGAIVADISVQGQFYRIPAPVHPDPKEHPVIANVAVDKPGTDVTHRYDYATWDAESHYECWNHDGSYYGSWEPSTITEWSPAKVVADDD